MGESPELPEDNSHHSGGCRRRHRRRGRAAAPQPPQKPIPTRPNPLPNYRHDADSVRRAFESGEYPLQERIATKAYEEQMAELQVELLKAQSWVKEIRRAHRRPLRRPRCGRQGRHHQALHGAPESARRPRRRAGETDRPRTHANGTSSAISKTCRPAAKSCSSTAPGTTAPVSSASWASARPTTISNSCASAPISSACWCAPASGCSNTGSRSRATSSCSRFKSREHDPLKQWKLSPIDKASLDKWDDYTEAKEAMFFYTDTADAPWTIIKSDDKKRARLNCMRHFLRTALSEQEQEDRLGCRSVDCGNNHPRHRPR